jgi:hypothetical protein
MTLKNLFVMLKILILLLLLSCQRSEIFNLSITPLKRGAVMDPSQINFLNEYYIIENVTVRLVEMDAKAGYRLMLASSIEQKSDLEYIVKIKNTGFSNGEKIRIEDVHNSLMRAKQGLNSHVAFNEMIERISIENDSLKIKLKKKVNDFLYFLTLADLSILHSSQAGKKELTVEDWHTASSGPYSYSIENEEVFLTKNPYYKLSSSDYLSKIRLISGKGRDTFEDFTNNLIDIGEFNLNSFEKHLVKLTDTKNLVIIGNNGDMINYLALNVNDPKFKSEYNRQWIQKKMVLHYSLDDKYKNIARKAFQFFTPFVKGFVNEKVIVEEVKSWKDIDITKIPDELKEGITISTYQRAFEVSLRGAFDNLEKVLGIPVKIEANVPSNEFKSFILKRNFEVFLGITSMDQVIVGEAIHFQYFSGAPTFKDVNKKIKRLLFEYQNSGPSKIVGAVNSMAIQMIKDAECVPVFYVASPFFYNKKKFDISGLDEMTYFNLWKIKAL